MFWFTYLILFCGIALLCWALARPWIVGVKLRDYTMAELTGRSQQITWSFYMIGLSIFFGTLLAATGRL